MGSLASRQPMCSASSSATYLTPDASEIIMASLDKKTKTAYLKVWEKFSEYGRRNRVNVCLPVSVILLLNFLTSLFHLGYQPSTIASHVSAIAFIHKIQGYPDPTSSFLVHQFLKGAKKLNGSAFDMRLPITATILHRMILALPRAVMLLSQRALLKAIFLLSFNAFLRMGEICIKHGVSQNRVIQRDDICFIYRDRAVVGMRVVIRYFKNNVKQLPMTLLLPVNRDSESCCPVRAMQAYLREFKHVSGPLFQFQNGLPVSYAFVSEKLRIIVSFLGLDQSRYKPHSFRIGAATSAFCQGLSEDNIKRMGRWESNAVQRYIRVNCFSFPK